MDLDELLGDTTESVKDYAGILKAAVTESDFEKVSALGRELQTESDEVFCAVWWQLDSKTRAAIKKILANSTGRER